MCILSFTRWRELQLTARCKLTFSLQRWLPDIAVFVDSMLLHVPCCSDALSCFVSSLVTFQRSRWIVIKCTCLVLSGSSSELGWWCIDLLSHERVFRHGCEVLQVSERLCFLGFTTAASIVRHDLAYSTEKLLWVPMWSRTQRFVVLAIFSKDGWLWTFKFAISLACIARERRRRVLSDLEFEVLCFALLYSISLNF